MKDRILALLGFPAPTLLQRLQTAWPEDLTANENCVVLDMRAISNTDELKQQVFELKNSLKGIKACGKILLVGLDETECSGAQAIYQRSLVGITLSLAKEIGRRGKTVNLVRIPREIKVSELPLVLSFFTSGRSAFISGQVIPVNNSGALGTLKNKVCVVTGGAGGIGLATVKRLALENAKVVIVDMLVMKSKVNITNLKNVEFIGGDLTKESDRKALLAEVKEKYGKIDVLINNAGITRDRTLSKMSEKEWDQLIAINLEAVMALTDACISMDMISENGRVINTSSISGIAGNFGQTNYTASKAALIEMGKVYSNKLMDKGITVNAIAPGYIETDMVKSMPLMTRIMAERLTCLAQAGKPEDIAEAMVFLAHPGSQGIKGEVLRVCGGSFLGA